MTSHLFSTIRDRNQDPARPFLETPDGRKISYGELFEGAGRFANALRCPRRRGPATGSRCRSRRARRLILLCSAASAPARSSCRSTPAYTLAELEYFIGDAEPALFVCDASKREGIKTIGDKLGVEAVETLDAGGSGSLTDLAARQSPDFEDATRGPDDLAAILYTSGTTGRSKGAMLSHGNLASNALTLVDYWRFTTDDVLLHALPIFHTHGLFVATNTSLIVGRVDDLPPKFDADEIAAPDAAARLR